MTAFRPLRAATLLAAALLIAAAAPRPAAAVEESRTFGRFGTVWLYHRAPVPSQVVLFVSGDGGWNQGVVDMARELAGMDALVVGVDIVKYFKVLEASGEKCAYPASDFEALSQFVQRDFGFPNYVTPVLVGYSSGATLVYALLAQAPPTTFRGAISLGFCPDLEVVKPFCKGSGLTWRKNPKAKGVLFDPAQHLETPWIALQGTIDQVCDPPATEAYVAKVPHGEIVILPKVGHGYSVPRNWMPQFKAAFKRVITAAPVDPTRLPEARVEAVPAESLGAADVPAPPPGASPGASPGAPSAAPAGSAPDLPLIEVLATGTAARGELAIHLTGDGGWGVTDKGIANELAAAGVPVVGWNSLHYFWKQRDPDQTARDLERVLRYYLLAWHREKAILIGYSFGADVLPIIFNRLPEDLRARVPLVVLLGPSAEAGFVFHVTGWLGTKGKDPKYPVAPEIARMIGPKILCFCGADDDEAICRQLDPAKVTSIVEEGGHRIGRRFDGMAAQILGALP